MFQSDHVGIGSPARRSDFVRPEGAEHFIEEVRGDEPEFAEQLRIDERELEADAPDIDGRATEAYPPS